MRIAVRSNALHVTSGYAVQARLLLERLQRDGHDVALFMYPGLGGSVLNIGGIPHYPSGRLQNGADMLPGHVIRHGTQLLITLHDLMAVDPATVRALREQLGIQVWHWFPVDCEPELSVIDHAYLQASGGRPVAMSRFGEVILAKAGYTPLYVPHAVDTSIFRPADPERRRQARKDTGLDGKFVIAVNAANKESVRKGWFELYAAFAEFHAKHPDSVLLLHTEQAPDILGAGEGVPFDHAEYARLLGIEGAVLPWMTQDYVYKSGLMDAATLAGWYSLADLYVCASLGEGFGVPLVEAAACGVPLAGTACSAVTELVRAAGGWLVPSHPVANPVHKRVWRAPDIGALAQIMGKAHAAWRSGTLGARQRKSREMALAYSADLVYERDWAPAVKLAEEEAASDG